MYCRLFRRMDEDGNKNLNFEEFLTGLRECGMEITDEEAEGLFKKFDTDGNGNVNIDEFLVHVRVCQKNLELLYHKLFIKSLKF